MSDSYIEVLKQQLLDSKLRRVLSDSELEQVLVRIIRREMSNYIYSLSPLDILLSNDRDLYSNLISNNKPHIPPENSTRLENQNDKFFKDGEIAQFFKDGTIEQVVMPQYIMHKHYGEDISEENLQTTIQQLRRYGDATYDEIEFYLKTKLLDDQMDNIKTAFLKLYYRRLVLNLTKLEINGKYYIRRWVRFPEIKLYTTDSHEHHPNSVIIEIQEDEYYLVEYFLGREIY